VAAGHQQGGLGQDQLGHGGDQIVLGAVFDPGVQRRFDHEGDIRIVRQNLRCGGHILDTAAKTELECLNRNVLQHGTHLCDQHFRVQCHAFVDPSRITNDYCSLHWQRMAAHAREGENVRRQSAARRCISGGQTQHSGGNIGDCNGHDGLCV